MPRILTRATRVPGEELASDRWRTPGALFRALHAEFNFHLDVAADAENHLLDRWFGPGGLAEDALAVEWTRFGRRGFLNPPYSSELIKAFTLKALQESEVGFTTVALIPYTPSTKWWQHAAAANEIRELPARVKYLRADGVTPAGAMFPSAIVIWRPQPGVIHGSPRRVLWDFPKEGRV